LNDFDRKTLARVPILKIDVLGGFIEANGGEVEVESLPGQGSSFVVTFAVPTAAEVSA